MRIVAASRLCFARLALGCALTGAAAIAIEAAEPAAPATPSASPPAVRVAVDPRVELFSIIFRLAGNPEYGRGWVPTYNRDIERYFSAYRGHATLRRAIQLRETRSIGYDACISLAIHLTDDEALAERVPLDPRPLTLDARWSPPAGREFAVAARQFARDTAFGRFFEEHRPLYVLTEQRLRALVDQQAHFEWFASFFGPRSDATFTVVPGMLTSRVSYGPRCRTADGKEELFCILGVSQVDSQGLPVFSPSLIPVVIHEFCHSYVNRLVDMHQGELRAVGETIYPLVAQDMEPLEYHNWLAMLDELVVRLCVLRYRSQYEGPQAAWTEARREEGRGFMAMEELLKLLDQFETGRDQYPTFEAFFPRVVAYLSQYAGRLRQQEAALAPQRPKIISMTPANGATNVSPDLNTFEIVFDRPMNRTGWSLGGSSPHAPRIDGKPRFDEAGVRWTIPVRLRPDWEYNFWLSATRYFGFQSAEGVPLAPIKVRFKTGPNTLD